MKIVLELTKTDLQGMVALMAIGDSSIGKVADKLITVLDNHSDEEVNITETLNKKGAEEAKLGFALVGLGEAMTKYKEEIEELDNSTNDSKQ